MTPLPISVITVGYRGAPLLARCLESMLRSQPPPAEVIVVDNDSPEDLSPATGPFEAQAANAGIRSVVLRAPRNLGFGQGNALGLQSATQPYVMLLNPDTEVAPAALGLLVEAAASLPQPAAVQPLIVFAGRRGTINSAGVVAMLDGGFADVLCDEPRERLSLRAPVAIAAATGAAVLMRRQDIDRLGFFDPDFFLYVEDVDLGLRWRRAGAGFYLVPDAVVFHEYHGSTGASRAAFAFEISSNQLETTLKNFPTFELLPASLLWAYNTLRLLAGRGPDQGRARVRAALRLIARRKIVLEKRRVIRATGPDARIHPWIVAPTSQAATVPGVRRS